MTFGTNLPILIVGRVLVGMACGIATVLVPLYLSEVSPPAIRGKMCVENCGDMAVVRLL